MYMYTRDFAGRLRPISVDFRGFDSNIILTFKGWNSHVHRKLLGCFESTNLSRDNLSREIGRSQRVIRGIEQKCACDVGSFNGTKQIYTGSDLNIKGRNLASPVRLSLHPLIESLRQPSQTARPPFPRFQGGGVSPSSISPRR